MSTSIFVSFFLLVFFKEKAWPCAMDIPIIVGIRPLESTNSFVFVLLYYMKLLLSFTFRHFRLNSASVARAKALHPGLKGNSNFSPKVLRLNFGAQMRPMTICRYGPGFGPKLSVRPENSLMHIGLGS